ncbi:pyridoxamine 5'-phosphate oxidase-domain-containing protein [Xylariomycetidae sp. FL2044]|nr:pyridoxamine 5'-phosphate oxidase-domain-containing protein [Xylariomycetidae sp. FL2044]
MSTSTTTTSSAAAPWRNLFLEHIQTMSSPEFVLSTVRRVPNPSSSPSPSTDGKGGKFTYVPRARTCIFRGLWAELPVNPKNDAPLNLAGVYESDFPTFTTDCRMDKMAELWEDGDGDGGKEKGEEKFKGSGGGAMVEAIYWASGPAVQWRIRGRAYVLGPDVETSEGGRAVMAALRGRMAVIRGKQQPQQQQHGKEEEEEEEKEKGEWSFAREVTAHFGNLSPMMRGTFRNPPPGQPVDRPLDDARLGLGQKVTGLGDEVARAHFRVVVVVPDEVDRADLSDPERGRRWRYTYVGDKGLGSSSSSGSSEEKEEGEGGWKKVETWP